jgi:hypothetical protein
MECSTAASVITFCSTFEKKSARIYEEWARTHEQFRDSFMAFAKINNRNEQRVKRAYYNLVSDALETGFCFSNLKTDIDIPESGNELNVLAILNTALEFESKIQQFYFSAARSSKALLADVSREMEKIAHERSKRIEQLQAMAGGTPD